MTDSQNQILLEVEKAWQTMKGKDIAERELWYQRFNEEDEDNALYLARDEHSTFLFAPSDSPLESGRQLAKEVKISRKTIELKSNYLHGTAVCCTDTDLVRPFLKICSILITDHQKCNGEEFADRSERVIEKFRDLLTKPAGAKERREQRIGLIGELAFIRLIWDRIHPPLKWEQWAGPDRTSKDFNLGSLLIEVKASTQIETDVINIHGLKQLQIPEDKSLLLAKCSFHEKFDGPESVSGLIEWARNCPMLSGDERERLLDSAVAGLTEEDLEARYSRPKWSLYRIDDEFPRITPETLDQNMPAAAFDNVNYQINLVDCTPVATGDDETVSKIKELRRG